jgi:ABC transporter family protein
MPPPLLLLQEISLSFGATPLLPARLSPLQPATGSA